MDAALADARADGGARWRRRKRPLWPHWPMRGLTSDAIWRRSEQLRPCSQPRLSVAGSVGLGLACLLVCAALLAHWFQGDAASKEAIRVALNGLVLKTVLRDLTACGFLVWAMCTALGFILPTADSALYKAVVAGDDQAVASLLQQGADPEHGRRTAVPLGGRFLHDATPLCQAAMKGHTAIVEALLAAGARPDTFGPFDSVLSATTLCVAAMKGHTAIVEALLAAGARPDAGWTIGPLTFATPLTAAGNEEIERALRAAGAGWPSFILETLRGIVSWGIVLVVLPAIVAIWSEKQ